VRCWIDECPPGCGEADRSHCLACRARGEALEEARQVAYDYGGLGEYIGDLIHALKEKQP
jgi:hypothetical protein